MVQHITSAPCSSNHATNTENIPAQDMERYEAFVTDLAQREVGPHPDVTLAFRKLLLEPSVPLVEVARLAASPSVAYAADPQGMPYVTIWRPLGEAIEQFAELNDRLVDFVVELQNLPDGDGVMHDLPDFNAHCKEFYFNYTDPSCTDPDQTLKRHGRLNMNTFMAKLCAKGAVAHHLIHYGGREIQQTLELAPWEQYHWSDIEEDEEEMGDEYPEWRDARLEELSDIRHLNGTIPAVAQWIKYQGRALYEMTGPMDVEYDELWKEPHGWSKERWEFWRQRFEWVSLVTALDRSTKNIAKEAAEEMARIAQGA